MPINPNGAGRAQDARDKAIIIYSNLYDKRFTSKDVKDLNISVNDIKLMSKYEWLIKTYRGKPNIYSLTKESIHLIENYYKSEEIKTCTKCGKTKKVCEFNLSKTGRFGVSSICSQCVRDEAKRRYKEKTGV